MRKRPVAGLSLAAPAGLSDTDWRAVSVVALSRLPTEVLRRTLSQDRQLSIVLQGRRPQTVPRQELLATLSLALGHLSEAVWARLRRHVPPFRDGTAALTLDELAVAAPGDAAPVVSDSGAAGEPGATPGAVPQEVVERLQAALASLNDEAFSAWIASLVWHERPRWPALALLFRSASSVAERIRRLGRAAAPNIASDERPDGLTDAACGVSGGHARTDEERAAIELAPLPPAGGHAEGDDPVVVGRTAGGTAPISDQEVGPSAAERRLGELRHQIKRLAQEVSVRERLIAELQEQNKSLARALEQERSRTAILEQDFRSATEHASALAEQLEATYRGVGQSERCRALLTELRQVHRERDELSARLRAAVGEPATGASPARSGRKTAARTGARS